MSRDYKRDSNSFGSVVIVSLASFRQNDASGASAGTGILFAGSG